MVCTHALAVRNVALAGHGGVGKTTLAEQMLFRCGAIPRRGSVDDGTSLLDADDEERRHHFSTSTHLSHLNHAGCDVTLLDTPGYPDFIGQVVGALRGVETALIVLSATAGIEANTRRVFQLAGEAGLGRVLVVNKLDQDNIDFAGLVRRIQSAFGRQCVPINLPNGLGENFTGVIDTLTLPDDLPADLACDPDAIHSTLMDVVAEANEELLERYLAGEPIGTDDLYKGMEHAIATGAVVPILCVSARTGAGVLELLDFLANEALAPLDVRREALNPEGLSVEIPPDDDSQLVAQVIKNRIDPFVSKLSCLRVFSGRISRDAAVTCAATGKSFRINGLYRLQGNTPEPIDQAGAGDIVALMKMDDLHVGDTLIDGKNGRLVMPPLKYPTPMIALGVEPRSRQDQTRLSTALHRIAEEDPTFHTHHEEDTHELVMRGMSELHLKIVEERLQRREKVEVVTHPPRIPYRETVQIRAEGMYRHKKQTGGAGQFAEVHLRLHPFPSGYDPGEFVTAAEFAHLRAWRHHPERNLLFVDCIAGGSIPNQFLPAIEKGFLEQAGKGVVAGYPVQDVCVEVYFGKSHDVDSNENAFRTAAAACLRSVLPLGKPALLEPIVRMEVLCPADKVGDVTADLIGRRGRIDALDSLPGGDQIVTALVPLAQVATYARTLSGITGGSGSFTLELSHYSPMAGNEQHRLMSEFRERQANGS